MTTSPSDFRQAQEAKLMCERARRLVRDQFDLVPLENAVFLWHHYPLGSGKWPEQSFVVVAHQMDGVNPHAFTCSTGADSEGWPSKSYNNPAFVFGQLIFRQWKSEAERVAAIAEFAKIEELDWARELLRGMAYNLGAFEMDDVPDYWSGISNIDDVERYRDGILEALERASGDRE